MYDTNIIEEEMERQNLTNERLAVKANLSASTISAIRNREVNLRLPSLEKAASALGLDVEIRFVPKVKGRQDTQAR